jgi:hypothetical protein
MRLGVPKMEARNRWQIQAADPQSGGGFMRHKEKQKLKLLQSLPMNKPFPNGFE